MSTPNSIAIGDIRFLDNCVPELTAGEYQIDVTHTIQEASFSVNTMFEAKQKFEVVAPRFALPAGTILTRYPHPMEESDFHESLPFVVFNDKHLPWMRALNGGSTTMPPSWVALMIFKQTELLYTPPPAPAQSDPTLATVRPITFNATTGAITIGAADPNVICPAISLDDYEQSIAGLSATTIDITMSTFQALAPQLSELPYLAHVRQINTGGQTIDGITGNGYYSVVLGNRLPPPAATPTKYIAHLVSLEGWENYLLNANTPPNPYPSTKTARIISLDSWTFTNDPNGADFAALVNNLNIGTLCLPFNPPATWATPTPVQAEVKTRYNNGYTALNYTTRLGQKSFAWYRGPFTPTVPNMVQNTLPGFTTGGVPLTNPDEAIIYDPVNGVFDQSFAVAFEIGKMVTLANKSASLAIWQWKRDGVNLLQILNKLLSPFYNQTTGSPLATRKLAATPKVGAAAPSPAPAPAPDWEKIKSDLTNAQAGHQTFADYVSTGLGQHFAQNNAEPVQSPVQLADMTKLSSHNNPDTSAKHMPGLLTSVELKQVAETGQDPHTIILKKLFQSLL